MIELTVVLLNETSNIITRKKGQEFDDADWNQGENMHLKMAKYDREIVQSTI